MGVPERPASHTQCLLFVYGSLKRGQANHRELSAARFIATVRTAPTFALRDIAGYPALVPGDRAISGELYELPRQSLPRLDEFEGEGYLRETIELAGGIEALAYIAREPGLGTPLSLDEWPALANPTRAG
jgi:gamma-glutamylcyclotransferase (GGCT)/AIG2-like uncharacterized protein YtfP